MNAIYPFGYTLHFVPSISVTEAGVERERERESFIRNYP
jgi:hypothetical protein